MKNIFLILILSFISIAILSSCQQEPLCEASYIPCGCNAVYAPVCGCDGKTYSNDCEASCAQVAYINGPCL